MTWMTEPHPYVYLTEGFALLLVAARILKPKRKPTRMELARQALAADVARRKAAYHAGQKRDARGRFCA